MKPLFVLEAWFTGATSIGYATATSIGNTDATSIKGVPLRRNQFRMTISLLVFFCRRH
jgi:hypothetical protein